MIREAYTDIHRNTVSSDAIETDRKWIARH